MMGFTPVGSTLGGLVLGVAISILILFDGRIAGISGIVGRSFGARGAELSWRLYFLGGLVVGGLLWRLVSPGVFGAASSTGLSTLAAGGFLVGVGTTLGNGCTSGHGLCGISRLSPRHLGGGRARDVDGTRSNRRYLARDPRVEERAWSRDWCCRVEERWGPSSSA